MAHGLHLPPSENHRWSRGRMGHQNPGSRRPVPAPPARAATPAEAPEGGEDTGPNPTERGKSGSKHPVMTEAHGIPLAATVTAANVNAVTQVFQVLTDMPPVGGKPGPKRQKPDRLQGDAGYDSEPVRQLLRWLGITPVLAARYTENGSGLGVLRWFIER